jgi:hypothetical protein
MDSEIINIALNIKLSHDLHISFVKIDTYQTKNIRFFEAANKLFLLTLIASFLCTQILICQHFYPLKIAALELFIYRHNIRK